MRRTGSCLLAASLAALLAACGGVDRGGSRNDIVDAMRSQGFEADAECVGHVLDGYSDSSLEAIDDQLRQPTRTDPRTRQFLDALVDCSTPTTAATP